MCVYVCACVCECVWRGVSWYTLLIRYMYIHRYVYTWMLDVTWGGAGVINLLVQLCVVYCTDIMFS